MADRKGTISQGFERFEETAGGELVEALYHDEGDGTYSKSVASHMRIWSSSLLQWIRWDGTVLGLGGGGGAVTVADAADVAQGSTIDVAWTGIGAGTLVSILKAIYSKVAGSLTVVDGGGSLTVDGTVAVSETAGVGVGAAADAEAAANGSAIAILKRLRTLLAAGLPAALVGGRLDVNNGSWMGSTAPSVGQKAMANSIPVVVASDQAAVPVSGTVTANQGTAAALASAWPAKVTDGVNTMPTMDVVGRRGFVGITDGVAAASVKGTNTPPVATDNALAVTIRQTPNEGTAFTSASRAAGTYTFDITDTTGYTGIVIITDLTVLGASSTVTNSIQVKDPVTAKFATATAAVFTVINSVSTTRQAMHAANGGAAGNLQGGVMTKAIRINVVVATAASTFSVGYSLTP